MRLLRKGALVLHWKLVLGIWLLGNGGLTEEGAEVLESGLVLESALVLRRLGYWGWILNGGLSLDYVLSYYRCGLNRVLIWVWE